MNTILLNLKNADCEIDAALDRTLNDEEFLLSCICQVLSDSNFEKLGEALNEKDYSSAFDYAHTLKGITANVGLSPVYNIIVDIVEPLRHNKIIAYDRLYVKLLREKQRMQDIIDR